MQQQYHQTTGRIAANYQLSIFNSQLALRFGIENLFDKRYTTYADWCDIPQKGRNIYMNLSFEPVAILGIILPIYTIIDMVETAENVWSDSCVSAMVDRDLH